MRPEPPLTDDDLYPGLSPAGRRMLEFLREHPAAPVFRNQSGHRLRPDEVERLREVEREVAAAAVGWPEGGEPDWLGGFLARCAASVPFYRNYAAGVQTFAELPTISRADLSRDVAAFVPDGLPLDRLINFRTSGTTGHPLLVPSHPTVAASYAAFHRRALAWFGIEPTPGPDRVGVVLVGFQRSCFTYVSVNPTLGESGLAKINLHPGDWRDPADPARYLDALAPELYTGDPLSLPALAELPLATRPRALLSTSMALGPGLRRRLAERFGCPVLDVYSLNEAGPVAASRPGGEGLELLQPRLFVEILDDAGRRLPPGRRGEVALTGGFNPWLPLLRYRTGDFARLTFRGQAPPLLLDLAGRPPVRFRTMAGEWINNLEVTHALGRFALPQYALHQDAAGALEFAVFGPPLAGLDEVEAALRGLFGAGQPLAARRADGAGGKVVQYTSDLAGALP